MSEPAAKSGWFGSPYVPRGEVIRQVLVAMTAEYQQLGKGVPARADISDVVNRFNRRVLVASAIFMLATWHRGSKLERLTWIALFGHPNLVVINDKVTEAASCRLFPVWTGLANLLWSLWLDLESLQTRLHTAGLARVANRLRRLLTGRHPRRPFFLQVVVRGSELKLVHLRTADVASHLATHGLAVDAGRHFHVTRFADAVSATVVRRAGSGHGQTAGQAFHYAGGASLDVVLTQLRRALAAQWAAWNLPDDWTTLGKQRPRPAHIGFLGVRDGETGDAALQAYTRNDHRSAGRRSTRVAMTTTANLAKGEYLRTLLFAATSEVSSPVVLWLSMLLVDGLVEAELFCNVWQQIAQGATLRAGRGFLVFADARSGRRVPFFPSPPTLVAWHACTRDGSLPSVSSVRTQACAWIRARSPNGMWDDHDDDMVNELRAAAHAVQVHEAAPWLVSAADPDLGAAGLSEGALLRFLHRRPLQRDVTEKSRPRPRRRTDGQLSTLAGQLAKIGDRREALGEEHQRKSLARQLLMAFELDLTVRLPLIEAVLQYLWAECTVPVRWAEPVIVSTTAEYLGDLSRILDVGWGHPLEWPADAWLVLVERVKLRAGTRQLSVDDRALRRFARYWRAEGADVPADLFAADETHAALPAHSAASHFLWRHESQQVRRRVLAGYRPESLQHAVASVYLDMLEELPLRTAEHDYLRLQDLDADLRRIAVTTSGFAHLKTDESRRSLPLSQATCATAVGLRERLVDCDAEREYFFFRGRKPFDDPDFVALVARVASALRDVTGDASLRRYTLRGVAENRALLGDVEAMLGGALNYDSTANERGDLDAVWRQVVVVAAAAAHHPLTAVRHYLVAAPVVRWRSGQLACWQHWPGEWFLAAVGVPSRNRYAWRHRAEHAGTDSRGLWQRLIGKVDLSACDDGTARMAPHAPVIDRVGDDIRAASKTGAVPARRLWREAMRASGIDAVEAGDRAEDPVGVTAASTLIPNMAPASRGVQLALKRWGLALSERAAQTHNASDLRALLQALEPARREVPTSKHTIVAAVLALRRIVPPEWIVAVLPEAEGLPAGTLPELTTLGNVRVKAVSNDSRKRFRLSVWPDCVSQTSARTNGTATAAVTMVVRCRLEQLDEYQSITRETT